MAVSIERNDDISLNGVHYKTLGPVKKAVVSRFPGKVVIGDTSRSSQQNSSEWVISDVTGGVGVENINEQAHIDRFWYSDGLWTLDHKAVYLPPLIQTLGGSLGFVPTGAVMYSDKLYVFGARYVKRWNTTTNVWDTVVDSVGVNFVSGFVWKNSSGTSRIYISCGSDGFIHSTTGDNGGWTTDADIALYFAEFDRKLIKTSLTTLDYSTDGTTWTSLVTFQRNSNPNGLAVFRDEAGDEVIAVAFQEGIYNVDFWTGYMFCMVDLSTEMYARNGVGMLTYRNEIFAPAGRALLRITGNTVVDIGIHKDDGVVSEHDARITRLLPIMSNIYALLYGGDLAVWNGRGWHYLDHFSNSHEPAFIVADTAVAVTDTRITLYFSDYDGTNYFCRYIQLPLSTSRPIKTSGFAYDNTRTLYTGDFDASFTEWVKVITSQLITCSGMSATETIAVSYSTDSGSTWTAIGTANSDGSTTYYIPSSSDKSGISVKKVRLKFVFSRGTTEMLTNGGFETLGAGGADVFGTWVETAGNGAIASEGTIKHAGSYSLKLTAGAAANTKETSPSLAVTGGDTYQLGIWSYGDGTYGGRYLVYDVTNSANIVAATEIGVVGAGWAQRLFTFTVPSTCTSINVQLLCSSTNTAITYFDDITLVNVSNTPVMESASLSHYLAPSTLFSYTVTIDCREDYDSRTPKEQMDALETAMSTATKIVFTYIDGEDNYVRVMPSGGNENGGVAQEAKGTYTLLLMESG